MRSGSFFSGSWATAVAAVNQSVIPSCTRRRRPKRNAMYGDIYKKQAVEPDALTHQVHAEAMEVEPGDLI